jgi:hypothetical protein
VAAKETAEIKVNENETKATDIAFKINLKADKMLCAILHGVP